MLFESKYIRTFACHFERSEKSRSSNNETPRGVYPERSRRARGDSEKDSVVRIRVKVPVVKE